MSFTGILHELNIIIKTIVFSLQNYGYQKSIKLFSKIMLKKHEKQIYIASS